MSRPTRLVWLSVNLEGGGLDVLPHWLMHRHGDVDMTRLSQFPQLVMDTPEPPDVIFLQEGKWFNHYGDELLLYVERRLREDGIGNYRGFLTPLKRSHHHMVVFINTSRLQATHHWRGNDPDEPTGLYGWVEVIVGENTERTVWLKSVHLDPWDGDDRLAEMKRTHSTVAVEAPPQRAILAGDFNSYTSRRSAENGEPQRRFAEMLPTKRYHKGVWPPTKPGGDTDADTRAVDFLLDVGWRDAHITLGNTTPTTKPRVDKGGAVIIDRCLTYGGLAPRSLWVDKSKSYWYSDHLAIGGEIEIIDKTSDR